MAQLRVHPPGVLTTLAMAALFALAACSTTSSDASMPEANTQTTPDARGTRAATAGDVPVGTAVASLATRRIYFGHQSVGADLVAGVDMLLGDRADARLNLVQTRDLAVVSGPALVHFLVGRNEDPASKNRDFLRVLDARPAADHGIALLKYCFVDVNGAEDARSIFDGYRRTIDEVHRRHPDLTVVHVTMPLTTVESAAKSRVKHWMGRRSARDLARKRQEYNQLLRAAYAGREPVFDLADVESRRADGSRTFFIASGDTIFTLAPEYTSDGGHLNAVGRRVAAGQLLAVLGRVAASIPRGDGR